MTLFKVIYMLFFFFFFQAEDGIRDLTVTGVQTCALPIYFDRAGLGPDAAPLDPGACLGMRLSKQNPAPQITTLRRDPSGEETTDDHKKEDDHKEDDDQQTEAQQRDHQGLGRQ